jgi:hypothetical protein
MGVFGENIANPVTYTGELGAVQRAKNGQSDDRAIVKELDVPRLLVIQYYPSTGFLLFRWSHSIRA